METGNLLKKEFRVVMVKMMKKPRRRMDTQSEKLEVLNKESKNMQNN